MKSSKLFYTLLTSCNLLFLSYFLILGYYNQPSLDDYCVIAAQKTHGFNSPFTFWYQYWNGRFLPHYLCNILFIIFDYTGSIIWLTIFLIVGFIFSINRLITSFFSNHLKNQPLLKGKILNLSVFIFSVFVFNNFKFNTFFWLNASTMYYGGILFFLLGLSEIYAVKTKWFSIPLITFSFVYAGCSTENHALIFLLFMFLLILLNILIFKSLRFPNHQKTYIACTFLIISFAVLMLAPGSQHRLINTNENIESTAKSIDLISFLGNLSEKYLLVIVEILLFYAPFALLTSTVLIYIFKEIYPKTEIKLALFRFGIWPIFAMLLLFIVAAIAPTVYIFGMLGPQRILTIVNALLLLSMLISLLYLVIYHSDYLKRKLSAIKNLSFFALIIIIILTIARIYVEIPLLKNYSNSEIEKRKQLAEYKNGMKSFEYLNAEAIFSPTLTETLCVSFISKYYPEKLKTWGNLVKNEPIVPNIIDKNDKKIYDNCYSEALGKKVDIVIKN